LSRELIERAIDRNVTVRAPVRGTAYFAFADPSGGVADSFTLAIAHAEGETVVLDCLVEILAPFDPSDVLDVVGGFLAPHRGVHILGPSGAKREAHDAVLEAEAR